MRLDSLLELVDSLVPKVYYILERHAPKTDQIGRPVVYGVEAFGERVCVVHPDLLLKLKEVAEREGVRLLNYKLRPLQPFDFAQSRNKVGVKGNEEG